MGAIPAATLAWYEQNKLATPDVDQEELQRQHRPPIEALKISRDTGEVVNVVQWTTRRAAGNRASRPGRARTISRQGHSHSSSRRGPPSSGEDGEPGEPPGLPAEVEPRPPQRGELVHVLTYLLPVIDRLAEGGDR